MPHEQDVMAQQPSSEAAMTDDSVMYVGAADKHQLATEPDFPLFLHAPNQRVPAPIQAITNKDAWVLPEFGQAVQEHDQQAEIGMFNHSCHIANAIFVKDLCKTLKGDLDRPVFRREGRMGMASCGSNKHEGSTLMRRHHKSIVMSEPTLRLNKIKRYMSSLRKPLNPQHILHNRIVGFVMLITIWATSGCVWRGDTSDHYFGPLLFGSTEHSKNIAQIDEQIHFPAVLESGNQWGLSLGVLRHITATPLIFKDGAVTNSRPAGKAVRSFFSIAITKALAFSPFYLRIDHRTSPEFRIRSLVGLQASVGAEGNFLNAGLSVTREFTPREDGLYLFCHNSRVPLEMTFLLYRETDHFPSMSC
jgi:hypothetical protein